MLKIVDGVGSLDEVFQRILAALPGDRVAANG
jgi:hypothetical protein